MQMDEITAHGIIFFVAGVESVATAMTHTAYFLAMHPEFQDKVIAEVDKAISEVCKSWHQASLREPALKALTIT